MGSISKEDFQELENTLLSQANNGDIDACKRLGDLYYQGYSGEDQNHQKAFPYWKKAADAGHASAAGLIGIRLFTGEYGADREREAIPYLIAAADAGVNGAGPQVTLGMAYEQGIGCVQNTELAKKYYRKAALQNDGVAQYYLGRLLFVEKDREFMHWFCCAHINGNNDATEILNTFIQNAKNGVSMKESIEWKIEEIKKEGIIPKRTSNSSHGSRGGCYIATAVYGSYNKPEVIVLRRFRDEVLLECWWGRIFVKIYYTLSPPMAEKLKNTKRINTIVRNILDMFVQHLREKRF